MRTRRTGTGWQADDPDIGEGNPTAGDDLLDRPHGLRTNGITIDEHGLRGASASRPATSRANSAALPGGRTESRKSACASCSRLDGLHARRYRALPAGCAASRKGGQHPDTVAGEHSGESRAHGALSDNCDQRFHESSYAHNTQTIAGNSGIEKKAGGKEGGAPADSAVGTLERGLAILQFFKRPGGQRGRGRGGPGFEPQYDLPDRRTPARAGLPGDQHLDSRWRLGRETAQLGVAALQSTDLMRVAPPVLLDLLEGTREAVNLAVFDTDSMVLVFREQGPQSVTISSRLGSRRPMHASGLGKAYIAALKPDERHALIERLDMKRFTPETIVDKAAFERGLVEIQKRGFADDRREFEQTLACCAAAVFDHRAVPVAAISVSGPADRILAKFDRIGAEVALAARAISARLGISRISLDAGAAAL